MQYPSKSQDLTSHPSQSGRTMVEIIGSLAIMGVLSIASFAVYRVAIDWYRANEITHGIMERSVIVRQQRDLDAELNLKEFHPDTDKDYIMGHEVTLSPYNNPDAGLEEADAMTVHDVSNTVCRRIAGVTGWDNMILFVNDVETDPEDTVASMDLCRAEETNDLTFAFWDGETIDVEEPGPGVDPQAKKDCGSDGTTLYRHGDDYGDCGKCDNGVFVGRSVSIPECQKCGSGTDWKLVNNDNVSCGTNKVCQSGACTCKIGTTPKTGTADTCVECNTNADCKDASKPVCNASGVCEACTTATVTHSDVNENGCCITSTETYCPATDETPTARTCTQTCSGTCETDGTCTPATPTCTGDLVLNSDETACVCPTGKVVKTGTTNVCVECNTDGDCLGSQKYCHKAANVCSGCPDEQEIAHRGYILTDNDESSCIVRDQTPSHKTYCSAWENVCGFTYEVWLKGTTTHPYTVLDVVLDINKSAYASGNSERRISGSKFNYPQETYITDIQDGQGLIIRAPGANTSNLYVYLKRKE